MSAAIVVYDVRAPASRIAPVPRVTTPSRCCVYAQVARRSLSPQAYVNVWDGFESRGLTDLWETIQPETVRSGRSAAKVVVHSRDKFEAGINGNKDSERAELMEARRLVSREDQDYW